MVGFGRVEERRGGLGRSATRAALTKLEATANADDLKALADAAHALKSMCANMGAARVAAACNQLEHSARTDEPLDVASHVAQISRELSAAISALGDICTARPA